MPQGTKFNSDLFMTTSWDRLQFRLPDPEGSPAELVNAGSKGPQILPRRWRRGRGADLHNRLVPIARPASAALGLPGTRLASRKRLIPPLGEDTSGALRFDPAAAGLTVLPSTPLTPRLSLGVPEPVEVRDSERSR